MLSAAQPCCDRIDDGQVVPDFAADRAHCCAGSRDALGFNYIARENRRRPRGIIRGALMNARQRCSRESYRQAEKNGSRHAALPWRSLEWAILNRDLFFFTVRQQYPSGRRTETPLT